MKFSSILAGAAALVAAVTGGASLSHASLIGTDVTLNYDFNSPASTTDILPVTAGIELSCPGSFNVCGVLTLPNANRGYWRLFDSLFTQRGWRSVYGRHFERV